MGEVEPVSVLVVLVVLVLPLLMWVRSSPARLDRAEEEEDLVGCYTTTLLSEGPLVQRRRGRLLSPVLLSRTPSLERVASVVLGFTGHLQDREPPILIRPTPSGVISAGRGLGSGKPWKLITSPNTPVNKNKHQYLMFLLVCLFGCLFLNFNYYLFVSIRSDRAGRR